MKLSDFLDHVKDEHLGHLENEEDYDYAGEPFEFDEGAALAQFRDCFGEDIE